MVLEFTKRTDSYHKIVLDSTLISAEWKAGVAYGGGQARFEIRTAMVGEGAPVEVKGRTQSGKTLGPVKGEIRGNRFEGSFEVPLEVTFGDMARFEAKLSKHGLRGTSSDVPLRPPIVVENMAWSAEEARRGDVLELMADIKNVARGSDATVRIYEYDQDGAHDPVAEIPARIENGKLLVHWEYEYHEDTDEIPSQGELERYGGTYNPPEYFFVIEHEHQRFGTKQESGLLRFKDFVEIELIDLDGLPIPDERYVIELPNSDLLEGVLDGRGRARVEGVPPGPYVVKFPDLGLIQSVDV